MNDDDDFLPYSCLELQSAIPLVCIAFSAFSAHVPEDSAKPR